MSLLHSLEHLLGLGQHQQTPQAHPTQGNLQAQQAASPTLGNNTPQAQAYAANPRMLNVDPAQFGYPQENSPLQVNRPMPAYDMPNLGVSFHQIQGVQNPGFTPMQNSGFGPGGHPQIRAFNSPAPQSFSPQAKQDGYLY